MLFVHVSMEAESDEDLFIKQSAFSNNKVLESDFELDLDGV